jgi:hypothetical protein
MIYVTQIEPISGTALLQTSPIWTDGEAEYRVAGGPRESAPEGAITRDEETGEWSAPLALPETGVLNVAGVDWRVVLAALGLSRVETTE